MGEMAEREFELSIAEIAADDARNREETHKRWEQEATQLDVQDCDELIRLVSFEEAQAVLESIANGTGHRPTTRLVFLSELEVKLLRMREGLA